LTSRQATATSNTFYFGTARAEILHGLHTGPFYPYPGFQLQYNRGTAFVKVLVSFCLLPLLWFSPEKTLVTNSKHIWPIWGSLWFQRKIRPCQPLGKFCDPLLLLHSTARAPPRSRLSTSRVASLLPEIPLHRGICPPHSSRERRTVEIRTANCWSKFRFHSDFIQLLP